MDLEHEILLLVLDPWGKISSPTIENFVFQVGNLKPHILLHYLCYLK